VNSAKDITQLEAQAKDERERLHLSAEDLRRKIELTKKKINLSTLAQNHFGIASGIAIVVGLTVGYRFSTFFTTNN
jgi:hypothetical protein